MAETFSMLPHVKWWLNTGCLASRSFAPKIPWVSHQAARRRLMTWDLMVADVRWLIGWCAFQICTSFLGRARRLFLHRCGPGGGGLGGVFFFWHGMIAVRCSRSGCAGWPTCQCQSQYKYYIAPALCRGRALWRSGCSATLLVDETTLQPTTGFGGWITTSQVTIQGCLASCAEGRTNRNRC